MMQWLVIGNSLDRQQGDVSDGESVLLQPLDPGLGLVERAGHNDGFHGALSSKASKANLRSGAGGRGNLGALCNQIGGGLLP